MSRFINLLGSNNARKSFLDQTFKLSRLLADLSDAIDSEKKMSVSYAAGLSPYDNKGVCGLPEVFDPDNILEQKITVLTELVRSSSSTVVHTGAGLSTSAGIPDFRGPKGVWTLEQRGESPTFTKAFEDAIPSVSHMALVALERAGFIKYLITQNVDGLHLRSGFPRNRLSILHGDMFTEMCSSCGCLYFRTSTPVPTIGLRPTGAHCYKPKTRVRPCGGKLLDTVLNWESELPEPDYAFAVKESRKAQLHICLGTSLQIFPAANLPFLSTKPANVSSKKRRKLEECLKPEESMCKLEPAKIVIVNLQPTKMDQRADICLRGTTDRVLSQVCARLGVRIPKSEMSKVGLSQIVLRSSHTAQSEVMPWIVLSHPENPTSPFATIKVDSTTVPKKVDLLTVKTLKD